jgi:hypothetical protein
MYVYPKPHFILSAHARDSSDVFSISYTILSFMALSHTRSPELKGYSERNDALSRIQQGSRDYDETFYPAARSFVNLSELYQVRFTYVSTSMTGIPNS